MYLRRNWKRSELEPFPKIVFSYGYDPIQLSFQWVPNLELHAFRNDILYCILLQCKLLTCLKEWTYLWRSIRSIKLRVYWWPVTESMHPNFKQNFTLLRQSCTQFPAVSCHPDCEICACPDSSNSTLRSSTKEFRSGVRPDKSLDLSSFQAEYDQKQTFFFFGGGVFQFFMFLHPKRCSDTNT